MGLGNYAEWWQDPDTPMVLTTTAVFTLATVGGALVLGLGLALVLNRRLVARGFARSVAFAPYVLSGIAVGMLWLYIFDPRYGLLSVVLGWFGVASPDWYNSSPWALIMLIVVYLWKNLGYVALIYLAGLQAVPAGPARRRGARRRQPGPHLPLDRPAAARADDVLPRRDPAAQLAAVLRPRPGDDPGRPARHARPR